LRPLRPKTPDHGTVVALQYPDFIIFAVGAQQPSLFRIGPDRDVPHRAIAERVLLQEPLLHEGSILLDHQDTVVDAT
jgi:hypothetical protein